MLRALRGNAIGSNLVKALALNYIAYRAQHD